MIMEVREPNRKIQFIWQRQNIAWVFLSQKWSEVKMKITQSCPTLVSELPSIQTWEFMFDDKGQQMGLI